jgi:hypothetical protein
MKVYRLFASVCESVEYLQSEKCLDRAFDSDKVSKLITVDAKSLADAINSFLSSPEFKNFSFPSKCYFYYFDDEGNLH